MPLITSVPRQRVRMRATCDQSRCPRSPKSRMTSAREHRDAACPRTNSRNAACRGAGASRRNVPKSHRGRAMPSQASRRLGLQRAREARAKVVLALGVGGRVDREHQRPVAGVRDAVDQRVDARELAGQVRLEPRIGLLRDDLLEADQRRSRHDHRDVRRLGASREHEVAAVRGHRADAHRADAERTMRRCVPRSCTDCVRLPTPTSTRGTKPHSRNAARLSRSGTMSSTPPET